MLTVMSRPTLLLSFRLENFRSIRTEQRLDLTRSIGNSVPEFPCPDVAPALAVFGANASGKSNLLAGLTTMFNMIRWSADRPDDGLPHWPFLLGPLESDATTFEVTVRIDDVRYVYGFSFDADHIISEWLRSSPKGRPRTLFERKPDGTWNFGDSLTGQSQAIASATRSDALLLSTAKILKHETLSPLQEQLSNLVHSLNSDNPETFLQKTLESMSQEMRRMQISALLAKADLGVGSVVIEEQQLADEARETLARVIKAAMPDLSPEELDARINISRLSPMLEHRGAAGMVRLPYRFESVGTQNFLALLGPILDVLDTGGILVVDEIDTSLHPRLVSELVRMFQSPRSNPRQAQLIFSTHDVTVMMNVGDYDVMNRDQLWFVNKDPSGATTLTPLSDFKPRKGEVFSRNYLNGRYGAVPRIDGSAFVEALPPADDRLF